MNVAMVLLNLEVGGLERIVVDLTLALAKQGHRMSVVTLRGGGALAAPLEAAGIAVTNLNCGDGLKIDSARKLSRALDVIAPTLVHSHGEAALFYSSLVRLFKMFPGRRGFAHVNTRHGYEDVSRRGVWRNRLAYHGCDAVVCVSEDLSAHCERAERVSPARLYSVVNSINLEPYRALPALEYVNDAPVLGHVARLAPIKNQKLLLNAFRLVRQEMPNAKLSIAGDGSERKTLEALVLELVLENSVTFHGETDDVPTILAHTHLFCLSSDSEGTPVSVIEAMAAGRPVVATDVGGLRALVNESAGRLSLAGDARALADGVLEVYSQRETYEKFCLGAATAVAVDAEVMLESYLSIYCAALN